MPKNPKKQVISKPKEYVNDDHVAFDELMNSKGWQRFQEIHAENIRLINEQILNKQDLDGKDLSNEEVDRLRDKRSIYQEVMDFPKKVVTQYETTPLVEPRDDTDPYPRDKKELSSMKT